MTNFRSECGHWGHESKRLVSIEKDKTVYLLKVTRRMKLIMQGKRFGFSLEKLATTKSV